MNILLEATILLPYVMGVIFLSTSIYVATIKPKDKKYRFMKINIVIMLLFIISLIINYRILVIG